MNRLFLILLLSVMTVAVFVGCSDGRCDECGKKAIKMNSESKEIFKDAGLKGDYCEDCLNEAFLKALMK